MTPSLLRPLVVRAVSLVAVLFVVLILLVVSLGAPGFSERMLGAVIGEELRALRPALAETIKDPEALEVALEARRTELNSSYGLDRAWFQRLPSMALQVFTLDLGVARTMRATDGSNRIADIVLERLPPDYSFAHHSNDDYSCYWFDTRGLAFHSCWQPYRSYRFIHGIN